MDLGQVISQIRQFCPIFQNRVGGAAQYENALTETANMPLPSCYVIPLEDAAEENESQTGLRQFVTERVGVIIEADATLDLRGQQAAQSVNGLKYAVFAGVLNWLPDPSRANRGFQYASGRLIHFDRRRIFWQLEFEWITTITENDGFQPDAIPIQQINMTVGTGDEQINVELQFFQTNIAATLGRPIAQVAATES